MKNVALAVLLIVMQTAPPVPRKTPGNSAQAPKNWKQQGNNDQSKIPHQPSSVETNGSGESKTDGHEQIQKNTDVPVFISKLPTVSVTKDWADWGVWVFSLMLVIVGFLQVCLLWGTLNAIRRQADDMTRQVDLAFGQLRAMHEQIAEMSVQTDVLERSVDVAKESAEAAKKSADAALLNAQVVINSERPWLFIKIEISAARYDGAGLVDNLGFSVSFHNYGKTPAEIVSFEQSPDCRDSTDHLPCPPEYSEEGRVLAHTRMVPSGETWHDLGESYFQPQTFVVGDQWSDIQRSRKRFVYWGRLRYRDLIEQSKTVHELERPADAGIHDTCFCYFWSPPLNKFLICGPVGYNKHT